MSLLPAFSRGHIICHRNFKYIMLSRKEVIAVSDVKINNEVKRKGKGRWSEHDLISNQGDPVALWNVLVLFFFFPQTFGFMKYCEKFLNVIFIVDKSFE